MERNNRAEESRVYSGLHSETMMNIETKIDLRCGDCLELMKSIPEGSVDSIVTDPPYGLSFMGKDWDHGVPGEHFWREAIRVAKPGAYLLAFGGTRTFHRLAVAIEDAGWEIRDCVMWVYGSGFPKSLDVSKAIDRAAGAEREVVAPDPYAANHPNPRGKAIGQNYGTDMNPSRPVTAPATDAARQWEGWGTALKPAWEPIIVARKPLIGTVAENVLKYGTGGINIDGSRVGTETIKNAPPSYRGNTGEFVAQNQNFTKGKVEYNTGRFPANLIHDGSEEVMGLFPETKSGKASKDGHKRKDSLDYQSNVNFADRSENAGELYGDSGSAARFFKCFQHETLDLLFCRAKAILNAWKIKNVSHAESSLHQQKQAVVSALSDAVIAASLGDKLLSDVKGLSTTVTASEFEKLCETLITAMLISESDALLDLLPDAPIQNGCLVNVAEIQKPTDTTTITISLPTSSGYADPVTFSIMPQNVAHGAKDSSADRFKYCAKASKADRDEGCEGMEAKTWKEQGYRDNNSTHLSPRAGAGRTSESRNHHPTVKPTSLMRYLCKLVTPPNGIILDPFMGSGSTGKAAKLEGFDFIGMDLQKEYVKIARARIDAAQPDTQQPLFT
jgi:DNA modification methylase